VLLDMLALGLTAPVLAPLVVSFYGGDTARAAEISPRAVRTAKWTTSGAISCSGRGSRMSEPGSSAGRRPRAALKSLATRVSPFS